MNTVLEVFFTLIIVVLLLLFFGVPLNSILLVGAAILLGLVLLSMLLFSLFFIVTDVSLLRKKPAKGKFVRIDDSGRFDFAVYLVDGVEYSCTFPAESFGRKRIYKSDHNYFLLIPRHPERRTALDRHSLITVFLGTLFSAFFVFLLLLSARYLQSLL